jgi:NitT/TauT family transport system substrate-binding protein
MSMRRTVTLGAIGWVAAISLLHGGLNLGLFDRASHRELHGETPFRVGYIPVTCHLTCPVTHFINDQIWCPRLHHAL